MSLAQVICKWDFMGQHHQLCFSELQLMPPTPHLFPRGHRALNGPTTVPVVLTSAAQGGGTVTLQTVPLTTVLANSDSGHGSPQRVILHTVPSSAAGGKDVLTFQTAGLSASAAGLSDSLQTQQLLVTGLSTSSGGVISTAGQCNGLPRLVTLSPGGQPVVTQQPGTVIATVLKPGELRSLQVKEEALDPQYLQSLVNSDPCISYGEREAECSHRTVIISGGQEGVLNGHSEQGEGLTPVVELEELEETKVLDMSEVHLIPVQVKTEPVET